MSRVRIGVKGPYDLARTLRAVASSSREPSQRPPVYRETVRIADRPARIEVRQVSRSPAVLEARSPDTDDARRLRETVVWLLQTDLDLAPFYRIAAKNGVLGPIAKRMRGLKAMRPASLFDMAVTAVTEQQISLLAAYKIRSRVVERYGERFEGHAMFPRPEALARARLEGLRGCGLSTRKAEYIRDFSRLVASDSFDLERLKTISDDEVREAVTRVRGFGLWSAEYLLFRGLGRPDVVPADDLGIRTILGGYFGGGARMSAAEVRRALEPFAPYRGVATFYLMVDSRLSPRGSD
jgi:DNA-3-methyladenine glycosylase II